MDDDDSDLDPALRLLAKADPRPVPGGIVADRFEIVSVAGRGGFGTVYRARERPSGREVALKLMRHGSTDRARFEREAEVLSTLHHPSIVSHVAHGVTAEDASFLAMEWIDGIDLAQRLSLGKLSTEEALAVAIQAANGLAAAHRVGVIHRDVKPSNLYLVGCSVDDVRVLDFGVARALDASASFTTTGNVVGTPAYMAPEQAEGVRVLSPSVDVFGLGCVLFECLTGRLANAGSSAPSQFVRLMAAASPLLAEHLPDAPPALEALVARMLARDPGSRFADGSAAAAAMVDFVGRHPAELRTFTTVIAQIAPWRTFAPESCARVGALAGEVVESGPGSLVACFASPSAEEAAKRASAFAKDLVRDEPSARVGLASARATAPPPAVATRLQLASALGSAHEGGILMDSVTARLAAGNDPAPR